MCKQDKKEKQIIYYSDERNDEFSKAQIKAKFIGKDWKYIHKNIFWKLSHFFWYRIVAFPIAFLYLKCKFKHKIIGREKLKEVGKSGYFLFGNHTHELCDAVIPTFVAVPKQVFVIVHANNVSMPVLGIVTPRLGAMPLPDDLTATKNFTKAVEYRVNEGNCVAIYPEAHIWPFYTKIRNFPETSFRYPVKNNKPSYCFTNTYSKKKKKIIITTYVDGPFYPNKELPRKEAELELRNRIYDAMNERSKLSDYEHIIYKPKEEQQND